MTCNGLVGTVGYFILKGTIDSKILGEQSREIGMDNHCDHKINHLINFCTHNHEL